MATNNPLLVPLSVKAFAINDDVLANKGVNIQRWAYDYDLLSRFDSPMPEPFGGGNNLPGTGVILHWDLPAILRRGVQGEGGVVEFPLVPNRWLVVRYSGPATARTATAWVVLSDALDDDDPVTGGAPYMTPGATSLQPTWVGQVISLDDYQGTAPPPPPFLTAVAPGNNLFASFQPYCQNVFSIFDPLEGVAAQDTLSYLVAGWYADSRFDIVGSWQQGGTFSDFLREAHWQLAAPSADDSTWALYHGMVWGVAWDVSGPAPSNVPDGSGLPVAVGNTATDALTALIKQQSSGNPLVDAELLEALQYGMLPLFDQPDAEFELAQKREQAWFSSYSGGYVWEIVNTPVDPSQGDPPPPLPREELEKEALWLAALNQAQSAYDNALRNLVAAQWNLYQVWWKYQYAQANDLTDPYPSGTSQSQFAAALNPELDSSLVSLLHTQLQAIEDMGKTIPHGKTQEELQRDIDEYELLQNLPSSRQLKQYALRPFAQAYDPVVLIQGLKTDASPVPTLPRACRFTSQLVTGFYFGSPQQGVDLSQVQGAIPTPANMSAVPSQILGLLYEFFLLDPGNATMVALAVFGSATPALVDSLAQGMLGGAHVSAGIRPDLDLAAWTQPWSPLVLLWEVVWYPIRHEDDDGEPLWTFDGDDYVWGGEGFDAAAPSWDYTGMTFLIPQASFNFRAQVTKFLHEHPGDARVEALDDFISEIDGWDFLSQGLSGLSQLMTLRDPSPNVSPALDQQVLFPGQTLSDLVGGGATSVPEPGAPQPPWPPSAFQNWRAGQFLIRRLYAVDRFGQTCEVVNSDTQAAFTPVLSPSLVPQHPVMPKQPGRFVQLPPRLLQPARLDFDFVSCTDDQKLLGYEPNVNPVCAWLLHNFLDGSIAAYDNVGDLLGSAWVVTDDEQQEIVGWLAAPGSPYATIADLLDEPRLFHLGQCLSEVERLGPAAFQSLLAALDEATWTVNSGATTSDIGLALLAGRPVAMVRARLKLELDAAAVSDPSWRFTFLPSANPVTGWQFNVRLGEAGSSSDGLIGYFLGSDYDELFVPNVPASSTSPYLSPVGTGASLAMTFGGEPVWLTMLMDPRAAVHATTGVLPDITLAIPHNFVDTAFARLEAAFVVGPLLTQSIIPQDPDTPAAVAVAVPTPFLKNGTWVWQQFGGAEWTTVGVAPTVPTAQLSNAPARLLSGLLRLTRPQGGPQ